jgi:hypothetical protein
MHCGWCRDYTSILTSDEFEGPIKEHVERLKKELDVRTHINVLWSPSSSLIT